MLEAKQQHAAAAEAAADTAANTGSMDPAALVGPEAHATAAAAAGTIATGPGGTLSTGPGLPSGTGGTLSTGATGTLSTGPTPSAGAAGGAPHFYMMELAGGLVIDAGRKGSRARLINSSCAPNCQAQKWTDAATGKPIMGLHQLTS